MISFVFLFNSLRNPDAAEALLNSVRDTFSVSKFKLMNRKTSVRIISGADEGIFSWVTTNYLTNVFNVVRLFFVCADGLIIETGNFKKALELFNFSLFFFFQFLRGRRWDELC